MSVYDLGIVTLVVGMSISTLAFADTDSVKCAQDELNGLGYDAGTADGKMGSKTRSAAEKYRTYMTENTPGWAMEPLDDSSAALWCEKVAEAWPDVAHFYQALQTLSGKLEANVKFDLSIAGPSGVDFALVLLKGDVVQFQGDGRTGDPIISFAVPTKTVAGADRFCVIVNPKTAHFEDHVGGKFPATCDALPGTALPEGVTINYSTELHAGE